MIGLEIEKAKFCIKSQVVFEELSIKLDAGEFSFIWGSNGSGKSSFLQCVAGLKKFSDIKTFNVADKVCYVPSNPLLTLFPWYSVNRNIKLFSGVYDPDDFNEFIRKYKQSIDGSCLVGHLSSGQQVVVLMYCLRLCKGLLLIDELFSYLSYRHHSEVKEWLLSLTKQGVSVIVVSHDPSLVRMDSYHVYDFDHKRYRLIEKLA